MLHIEGKKKVKEMYVLKSAVIEGLLGNSIPILFNFDNQFNFIIGKNGCGKTTVINLLAAILVCDFERLDKISFSKAVLNLQSSSSKKNPSITVIKKSESGIPYFDIVYTIKESERSKPVQLVQDEEMHHKQMIRMPREFRERYLSHISITVKEKLSQLIKVCWLSVHRKSEEEKTRDEGRNIPAVDQKLSSMTNDLVRYFSALSDKYEDHTKEFQKKSLLSLITHEKDHQVSNFSEKLDIDSEKKGISDAFALLQLEEKEYVSKVQQSYEKFSEARELLVKNKGLTLSQFFSIFTAIKAHSLVQYYDNLQDKRNEIFFPREEFVSVLNELFEKRKVLSISPRNEILIKARDKVDIKLEGLSSGEKQLIIILGEALLQEGEPVVYIADEPELSLHITWQEQLTDAIARLNPKAQIVFATHSPDIVGVHQDKVFDMEKLTS